MTYPVENKATTHTDEGFGMWGISLLERGNNLLLSHSNSNKKVFKLKSTFSPFGKILKHQGPRETQHLYKSANLY